MSGFILLAVCGVMGGIAYVIGTWAIRRDHMWTAKTAYYVIVGQACLAVWALFNIVQAVGA